ncbi:MAG: small multi-drug export protein [Methanomicrobiales archaeon]|nr:small multi-drug export protein [Methanomicrobiales archaeon]
MVEPGELEWFPQARVGPLRHLYVRALLPVALAFAWYFGCLLLLPPGRALIFGGLLLAYFIPPSGKESVIPLGIILGIPWYLMAASVVVLDLLAGLFMILNLDVAFRIPYLGPWIARVLGGGKGFLAGKPWLSRWGLPGLAFFVMLPFQGTGGTGAPLVGWMLGLRPWQILLAIAIGSSVEALAFAFGSELIWSIATTYLTYETALVLALAAIALMALVLYLIARKGRA